MSKKKLAPIRPFDLRLPREAYMPGGITIKKAITYDQGITEYRRMRKAILHRFDRLQATRFADASIIQRGEGLIPPSEIKSASQLSALLAESRWILQSPLSSVQGQKIVEHDALEKLHEHGYDFVNERNLREFGAFMEAMRIKNNGKLPDSDRVAELYDAAKKKEIPLDQIIKDFQYWQDNVDELEKSLVSRARGGANAATYKRNIQQRKRRAAKKK